ncbi:MAG: tRNA pseudouridine(38-40) synthase TruA [Clostridia bacterium]|nr:tRNA pseudouridine(38-40) synthase TruA [Clostridia bacterium]
MKILITLSYVGTGYMGYQLQGDKPTVALMLNRAVRKAFGFDCNVTGCSRTDSGVHALGYCATIEPKNKQNQITVPLDKIPIALNTMLPSDICVISAKEVSDDFHARYNVVKKEYVYKIRTSPIRDPFLSGRVLEYGREISDESLAKMQIGASQFIGTHKFDAFMSAGSKVDDTTRTVYKSFLKRKGDIVEFHVVADGFLYNMVRIMVGTLLDIERGKINESTISWIISLKDRKNAGQTARPDGLYLKKVYYH